MFIWTTYKSYFGAVEHCKVLIDYLFQIYHQPKRFQVLFVFVFVWGVGNLLLDGFAGIILWKNHCLPKKNNKNMSS